MSATPNYVWTNNWGWAPVGSVFNYGSMLGPGFGGGTQVNSCGGSYGGSCMVIAPGICSNFYAAGPC